MRLTRFDVICIVFWWGCWLILLVKGVWPPGIARMLDITRNEAATTGTVTSTDCGNHNRVKYAFDANGLSFQGAAEMMNHCTRIVAGSPITIHYSAKSPKHNTPSDPVANLWSDVIFFLLVCLLGPAVAAWQLSERWPIKRS
jgi:hypothetical protein